MCGQDQKARNAHETLPFCTQSLKGGM
eukprot:SAG11_NODE_25214_length_362_cov_0.676806_1_plen_26_part_10